VRQAAVASSSITEQPLKLTMLTPLLSDKNMLVRQTAERSLGLTTSNNFGQKTFWTNSSQMLVDNMISNIKRQFENKLLSDYTEALLTRDISQTASYHLGVAGMIPSPSLIGYTNFALQLLTDFGPRSWVQTIVPISNALTVVDLGSSIYRNDFFGTATTIGGWGFSRISSLQSSTIDFPSSISATKYFSNYDGYTSISGYASVSVSNIPPAIDNRYLRWPEIFEGTRVYSSSASWVERTSPILPNQSYQFSDWYRSDLTQPFNNLNSYQYDYNQPYNNWNSYQHSYTQPYTNWSTYP
jgi:hypothetical protein